ncbi:LicD family protein [Acidaminococcus fermentans]|uniref:LicD family protein n=1 Tax=Acidaminococcus fermentans TaxID=905 RepID=A0A6N7W0X7_ACIFE|nr:LicD family protein [Acidaminococcus fermentans]MSS82955.1 LicD family protein [Acidaminococcus fermentans]
MDQTELRKLQLIELDMLKEIHRVCQKNKIKYWLTGGTLIGAIRHKGFIPWDDDVDIAMMREDYNRFLKIAPKELKKGFHLQNWEYEPNFGQPYTKIRKDNTLLVEAGSQEANIHHGIFVDIFAYDKFPVNKLDLIKVKFSMQILLRMLIAKSGLTPWKEVNRINLFSWVRYLPFRFMAKFFDFNYMKKVYRKYVQSSNKTDSKLIFNSCETYDENHPIPEAYVKQVILHQFEDAEFYIPAEYDKLLRNFYGDYMQLPPLEQREGHHDIVELKLG